MPIRDDAVRGRWAGCLAALVTFMQDHHIARLSTILSWSQDLPCAELRPAATGGITITPIMPFTKLTILFRHWRACTCLFQTTIARLSVSACRRGDNTLTVSLVTCTPALRPLRPLRQGTVSVRHLRTWSSNAGLHDPHFQATGLVTAWLAAISGRLDRALSSTLTVATRPVARTPFAPIIKPARYGHLGRGVAARHGLAQVVLACCPSARLRSRDVAGSCLLTFASLGAFRIVPLRPQPDLTILAPTIWSLTRHSL
mmetsp:Transcript_41691/g.77948  ORF Transcript_41691/g.77948 Transcript_41691/m.77948 type:complete len:257 (+) Transcript_41691:1527-2297(+)